MFHNTKTVFAFATLCCAMLVGCPIELTSGSGDGAPAGSKDLTPEAKVGDLTPSDLSVVCARNETALRSFSSLQFECTLDSLEGAKDEAACTTARDACLQEHKDEPQATCQKLSEKIDCTATVQEIEDCIRTVSTAAAAVTCAMAGTEPEEPECLRELFNGSCKGFSDLYSDEAPKPTQEVDGGDSNPGRSDGGAAEGCTEGDLMECSCARDTAEAGYAYCDADGNWGACECDSPIDFDAGVIGEVDAGGGSGSGLTCADGYDLGSGEECNTCALANCCDSYDACRADVGCDCFWACTEIGGLDCGTECGLSAEYPDLFIDHSICLSDSCAVECGL